MQHSHIEEYIYFLYVLPPKRAPEPPPLPEPYLLCLPQLQTWHRLLSAVSPPRAPSPGLLPTSGPARGRPSRALCTRRPSLRSSSWRLRQRPTSRSRLSPPSWSSSPSTWASAQLDILKPHHGLHVIHREFCMCFFFSSSLPTVNPFFVLLIIPSSPSIGEWRNFTLLPHWPEKDAQLFLCAFTLTLLQASRGSSGYFDS